MEALTNIKETRNIDINIDTIPIDDPKTYQLYCEGRTTGTFQFESPGMQKYLRELKPSTFEDLIAMNALYRPGPMEYIPQFIKRKHGEEPISYDIPIMEKYLKDTYGITVYQEQVMLLSRLLADFTRGQSDGLRKAMGKKLKDKLAELKPLFINGGKKNGYNPEVLEKIWADWEKFASYAFNKSHATCYSWVAFQTAYLKANYPAEYMAAVLSRNLNDIAKLTKFMDECKVMKIDVKSPDVNESRAKFSVNSKGQIRFGLAAIKGVGLNAVQAILDERKKNGPFKSEYDLVERINLSACNRKVIESLALAGAFDCFGVNREDYEKTEDQPSFAEALVRYGQQYQNNKANESASLFGDLEEIETAKPEPEGCHTWSEIKQLDRERELVGVYLSAHPLDGYYAEIKYGCNIQAQDYGTERQIENFEYVIAGLVVESKELASRTGSKFGVVKLEDFSGTADLRLFGRNYEQYGPLCQEGTAIVIKYTYQPPRYQRKDAENKMFMTILSIDRIDNVSGSMINKITLKMNESDICRSEVVSLLEEYTTENDEEKSLAFSVELMNTEQNRVIELQSGVKFKVSKEALCILDDLGIDYSISSPNQSI